MRLFFTTFVMGVNPSSAPIVYHHNNNFQLQLMDDEIISLNCSLQFHLVEIINDKARLLELTLQMVYRFDMCVKLHFINSTQSNSLQMLLHHLSVGKDLKLATKTINIPRICF